MHKHHIVPKHMGGSDDPDNLILLTVEQHAEAHRVLFEQHGKWQDFMAWKSLSGQIKSDEIRRVLASLALKGKPKSKEHIEKVQLSKKGFKHSELTKKKMSEARKGRKITWCLNSTTPEANEKRSKTMTGKPKPTIECPHCGKTGGVPQMKQWHFDNCKGKL